LLGHLPKLGRVLHLVDGLRQVGLLLHALQGLQHLDLVRVRLVGHIFILLAGQRSASRRAGVTPLALLVRIELRNEGVKSLQIRTHDVVLIAAHVHQHLVQVLLLLFLAAALQELSDLGDHGALLVHLLLLHSFLEAL